MFQQCKILKEKNESINRKRCLARRGHKRVPLNLFYVVSLLQKAFVKILDGVPSQVSRSFSEPIQQRIGSLYPPGWDNNPSQVKPKQTTFGSHLPIFDGWNAMSTFKKKALKRFKSCQSQESNCGPCGRKAKIVPAVWSIHAACNPLTVNTRHFLAYF